MMIVLLNAHAGKAAKSGNLGAFDLFSTERFVRTGNGWTPT
jgi:hypothetical protein